jgi:hypothetical protein
MLLNWCISNNIGDALNVYLVKKITGKTPVYSPVGNRHKKYMCIGSILNHADRDTIVWGSGIANNQSDRISPCDIRAVRGPYTRNRALDCGVECPEVYGDPAAIMPMFYNPDIEKQYELGVIPHYVNQVECIDYPSGGKLINVFDDPETFVNQLKACKKVLCSSLHGLVLAQAYGIPWGWFEGTVPLGGDGVKFWDFFYSVGIKTPAPLRWWELVNNGFEFDPQLGEMNTDKLWEACPFK